MLWLRILSAVILSSSIVAPGFSQQPKLQFQDHATAEADAIARQLAEDKTLLGKMELIVRHRLKRKSSPASSIAYTAALEEILRLQSLQAHIATLEGRVDDHLDTYERSLSAAEEYKSAVRDYEIALAEFSAKLVASRMRDLQAAARGRPTAGGELAEVITLLAVSILSADYGNADPDPDPSPWLPALLPWPPPRSSATQVLSAGLFKLRGADATTLGNVDARLRTALSRAGYDDVGYYGVPGGFALVTRLEQVDTEGRALSGSARWSTRVRPAGGFSLLRLVRALVAAEPGHFRALVFVITSQPFATSKRRPKLETLRQWSNAGLNLLPPPVSRQRFTGDHAVTALVYEFEKAPGAREGSLLVPGRLTGTDHLRTSRILRFLRGPQ